MSAGAWPGPASWPLPPSPPTARRSLITRSGRYESRCMVRMYRSRSMSAAENLRYPDRDLAGSISPSPPRKRILDGLISANSGRTCPSTSPIPNQPPPFPPPLPSLPLPALDPTPADELRLLDALPVHVGAVEAAHVADGEPGALAVKLGVPPGYGHVVEEDVAIGVAARGGQVAVEAEPAARVGAAHDQKQRAAWRQSTEQDGTREKILAELAVIC